MKKKIIAFIAALLIVITGCNSSQPVTDVKTTGDVKDQEAIYSFLEQNVDGLNSEEFEKYIPFYVDINKDGTMDVIYNSEEWYGNLLYIVATDNGFTMLDTDKGEIHKFSDINVQSNFIIASGEYIMNGYGDERTDIYYFNNNKVTFLKSLITESLASSPPYQWTGTGKITLVDGYMQIEYSYEEYEQKVSEENNSTNSEKIIVKKESLAYKLDQSKLCYEESQNGENFVKEKYITDNSSTNNENENNEDKSVILITDLEDGDKVENFIIKDIDHSNYMTKFTLEGDKWVKGELWYSSYYEGYGFSMTEKLLDTGIKHGDNISNFYVTFDTIDCGFMSNEQEVIDSLTLSQKKFLEDGNKIEVYAHIKNPTEKVGYYSEGGTTLEMLDYKITNEASISNEDQPFIEGFTNETINGTEIDYSKYRCVIIPKAETINKDKLEFQKFYLMDEADGGLNCSIIGTLYDVTITYYEDMNDNKGTTKKYDKFTNSRLSIGIPFKSDMTHILIQGKVYINDTEYEEVEFTIDTMREAGDYEIIKH